MFAVDANACISYLSIDIHMYMNSSLFSMTIHANVMDVFIYCHCVLVTTVCVTPSNVNACFLRKIILMFMYPLLYHVCVWYYATHTGVE